ncbi:MAG: hypothetical protein AMXMBFR64_62250 [Myxococcales bacterium]
MADGELPGRGLSPAEGVGTDEPATEAPLCRKVSTLCALIAENVRLRVYSPRPGETQVSGTPYRVNGYQYTMSTTTQVS